MSDQVQQIKERLNIVDVVGQYVKLTKAGKNYKGLSPFSKEKTPSFFVSPDKGMYYDFSSGQGGDVFSFVERMEGLDFKGALEVLAVKAGVTLHKESKQVRDQRQRLYEIHEHACIFYEKKLAAQPTAQTYLTQRGIEHTTIERFRLGFAPDAWDALLSHLTEIGYQESDVEKAGLIKKSDRGTYYDRFRSRIVFPIFDPSGHVIAFSGRIHGTAAKDEKNAKYLNSPETSLFNKSRVLYGFHRAKQFIRKYDFTILVEGQMDLVLNHQIGYGNTVAVSGTGLTENHLMLVDKLSKKLLFAFDADQAGINSCSKSAMLALKRGLEVKVAALEPGKDPADCIVENSTKWKQTIKQSKHVIEYFLELSQTQSEAENWERRKLVRHVHETVLPFIAVIRSATDRDYFESMVAEALDIRKDAIHEDVMQIILRTQRNAPAPAPHPTPAPEHPVRFSRKDDLEKTLSGFLFSHDAREKKLLEEAVVQEKAQEYHIPLDKLFSRYATQKDALIKESEEKYPPSEDPILIVTNLMQDLAKLYIEDELEIIRQLQQDTEHGKADEDLEALATRVHELSKRKTLLE